MIWTYIICGVLIVFFVCWYFSVEKYETVTIRFNSNVFKKDDIITNGQASLKVVGVKSDFIYILKIIKNNLK